MENISFNKYDRFIQKAVIHAKLKIENGLQIKSNLDQRVHLDGAKSD